MDISLYFVVHPNAAISVTGVIVDVRLSSTVATQNEGIWSLTDVLVDPWRVAHVKDYPGPTIEAVAQVLNAPMVDGNDRIVRERVYYIDIMRFTPEQLQSLTALREVTLSFTAAVQQGLLRKITVTDVNDSGTDVYGPAFNPADFPNLSSSNG